MIECIYGLETFLIDKECQRIKENHHIEDVCVNRFDLGETPIKDILEDASIPSMFGDKKMIICDNSYLFTGVNKKYSVEQDISLLEQYLDSPNPDTILIFITPHEKLDERKKIVRVLKKKAHVCECNQISHVEVMIKELLEDYQIHSQDVQLLIDRVGTDLFLLENEIEKLKIYKWKEKKIEKQDILDITIKTIDLNIFTFIDHILLKRKEEAMVIYEELKRRNEEAIAIFIMLANQFRIMYQAKELLVRGYTEKTIAETLGIHPFRVKKAIEKARNYTSDVLLNYLEKIRDLDYKIKNGMIDKNLALELFILGL